MFGQKPLYVAIAQRKEERQSQLQLKHAQGIAGLTGSSSTFFPGGYPPLYYPALGDLQISEQPGLLYQPLSTRHGWMVNGFTNSIRPSSQISLVSPLQILMILWQFYHFIE